MEYLFLTPGNNGGLPMGAGGCTCKGDGAIYTDGGCFILCGELCPNDVCVHCEAFCGARCDCFHATGPGATRM